MLSSVLRDLAVTYVDTIHSGAIPHLESTVLALAQVENSAVVEEALAWCRAVLRPQSALPTEALLELLALHAEAKCEALRVFMAHTFCDKVHLKVFQCHLKVLCGAAGVWVASWVGVGVQLHQLQPTVSLQDPLDMELSVSPISRSPGTGARLRCRSCPGTWMPTSTAAHMQCPAATWMSAGRSWGSTGRYQARGSW